MFWRQQGYKYGVLLYLVIWFTGSLWMMALIKSGALTELLGVRIESVEEYMYCALAGAVGGCLYALRMFHEYYDRLTDRWILWYLLRPIKCAGAAVMTIVLFESGVMLLQTADTLVAKISIAFLVGFGYGKVMDKLKALTETMFNGKDDNTTTPPNDDNFRK